MTYETHTLDSGLRIILQKTKSNVVYCGVAVDAGTRDELPHESGMAHFTEHMSFKGTQHRTSLQIINRLDSVGGDLNAYTGKEETIYYCAIAREHALRAIDLLLDITLHSLYPQREMDKEVAVVLDEIESYNDSPSELIFDEFEQLLFPNHPLGRNILGEAALLRQLTSADMQAFARRLYRPERMVLYVYGDVEMKKILKNAECQMQRSVQRDALLAKNTELPADSSRQPDSESCILHSAFEEVRHKSTHQAHVLMGTRAFAATDPRHLHLYLLNNILGGPAMNSRFNLALRERNGLVYTVESNQVCYTDAGQWSVYFGCDQHDISRCQRLIRRELLRLCDAPLSPSVLAAAKRQLKGQILLSYDSGESVSIGLGKRYLHYGETLSAQQLCDRIDALTAQQLWDTAQLILSPDRLGTLMYVN